MSALPLRRSPFFVASILPPSPQRSTKHPRSQQLGGHYLATGRLATTLKQSMQGFDIGMPDSLLIFSLLLESTSEPGPDSPSSYQTEQSSDSSSDLKPYSPSPDQTTNSESSSLPSVFFPSSPSAQPPTSLPISLPGAPLRSESDYSRRLLPPGWQWAPARVHNRKDNVKVYFRSRSRG